MRQRKAVQGARPAVVGLCYVLLTAACSAAAYWHTFTSEVLFDEGYLLLSLKQFAAGHALFTDVYSQYGPAFYELWGGIFSGFGIAVTPDAGRLATVVTWVLTSLAMGVIVHRMTGRLLLGLLAMVTSFGVLNVVVHAPMHPGATTCLGLVIIVGLAALVRPARPALGLAAIGAVAAGVTLMKVNVGGLALLAILLAICMTETVRWTAARTVAVVLFLAAPLVILGGDLGRGWVATLAATVIAGGIAVVLVASAGRPGTTRFGLARSLKWAAAGAAATAFVSIAIALALGTRLSDLVDGVLVAPTRQRDALLLPFGLSGPELLWSALGLGAAVAVVVGRRRRVSFGGPAVTGVARLAAGGLVLVGGASSSFFMPHTFRMGFALPLAWVVALPPPGPDRLRGGSFVRVLLPALAVLQPLHTYPVSGAQVAWGWLMFIPVGAVCIADGLAQLEAAGVEFTLAGRRLGAALLATLVVAAVGVKFVLDDIARPLKNHRGAYQAGVSLPFEGSTMIHFRPASVSPLIDVVSAIDARCPAFLTLPGMNSFYLWAHQEPPTGMNTTSWMYLLDARQQRHVVDRVRSVPRLCLLTHGPELDIWRQGRPLPDRPLVRFTSMGFTPVQRLPDGYVLSVRTGAGA